VQVPVHGSVVGGKYTKLADRIVQRIPKCLYAFAQNTFAHIAALLWRGV
jgi:hypothetical protein